MKESAGLVTFILVLVIVLSLALHFTLSYTACNSLSCFQKEMARCSLASYVHEEPQASWGYEIQGKRANQCLIKVTLLQAKEGDLELRNYEGSSMNCLYPKGTVAFPEKDMARCHGQLKEDLQGLIIKKIHQYILDNLGEIATNLNGF